MPSARAQFTKPTTCASFAVDDAERDLDVDAVATPAQGKLSVKLMLEEEEAEPMALLQADRAAIEQAIGETLEWNPHSDKKLKAIRIMRPMSRAENLTCACRGAPWSNERRRGHCSRNLRTAYVG